MINKIIIEGKIQEIKKIGTRTEIELREKDLIIAIELPKNQNQKLIKNESILITGELKTDSSDVVETESGTLRKIFIKATSITDLKNKY